MIYTFEISFNGSDYLSFTPTNFPKIETDKEEREYIWRNKVDEFQINSYLNESVYNTLETWYQDSDKYALTNRIRIKKSDVVKWSFVFGIKQGEINYENKVYKVTPETEDPYRDIFYYKGRMSGNALDEQYQYIIEDDATPGEIYAGTAFKFEDWMSSAVTRLNGFSDNTYAKQSAFLWNDNYPDGSSPGANNYISSDYNYLNDWAIGRDNSQYTSLGFISIEDLLMLPKVFQCHWYCASDYTIHFEHVRWFKEQIADYQLDISGLNYDDDARGFKYSTPEVFSIERFKFPTDNEADDYDNVEIIYEPELVNFRSESVEVTSEYDAYLSSDFANLEKFMVIGTTDLGVGWRSSTFDTWTKATAPSLDVTSGTATASSRLALSNYLTTGSNATIAYSIDFHYAGVPGNELELWGYNDTSPVGSGVTLLGSGNQSGTLLGNCVAIVSTGAEAGFSFELTVSISGRYRIPWEVGEISAASLPNNYLSWANNLNRFWRDDRYALAGNMNESEETFNSSKIIKEQDEFSFYYTGDINPMRGIKTDYGIGMIQSMTRDLESDFITVKLRYE